MHFVLALLNLLWASVYQWTPYFFAVWHAEDHAYFIPREQYAFLVLAHLMPRR